MGVLKLLIFICFANLTFAIEKQDLDVLGNHVVIDVRENRSGRGDVAAGLMSAIELRESLNYKGEITLLADGDAFRIISEMRNIDFFTTFTDPEYNFKVLTNSNLSTHPKPVSFYVRSAASSLENILDFKAKEVPKLKKVAMTVFAASEGRHKGFGSQIHMQDSFHIRIPSPGLGKNELGVYYDPNVQKIKNLEGAKLHKFITNELIATKNINTETTTNIEKILKLKEQGTLDTALLYGIWRNDQKEQFLSYALSYEEHDKPVIFITSQEADFEKLNVWGRISDIVEVINSDDMIDESQLQAGKIYIYKTGVPIPQSAFTGLMKASSIPYIIAGDGSLSAAVKLGEPFLTTRVPWNELNLENLAERLCRIDPSHCDLYKNVYIRPDLAAAKKFNDPKIVQAFSELPKKTQYSFRNLLRITSLLDKKNLSQQDLDRMNSFSNLELNMDVLTSQVRGGADHIDKEFLRTIKKWPIGFIKKLRKSHQRFNPFLKRNSEELREIYTQISYLPNSLNDPENELILHKLRGDTSKTIEVQNKIQSDSPGRSHYMKIPEIEDEIKLINEFLASNKNRSFISLIRSVDYSPEGLKYIQKVLDQGESPYLPVLGEIIYSRQPDNEIAQRAIFLCLQQNRIHEDVCRSLANVNELKSPNLIRELTDQITENYNPRVSESLVKILTRVKSYPEDQKEKLLKCMMRANLDCAAILLKYFPGDEAAELELITLIQNKRIDHKELRAKVLSKTPFKSEKAINYAIDNNQFVALFNIENIPKGAAKKLNKILSNPDIDYTDFNFLADLNSKTGFADQASRTNIVNYTLENRYRLIEPFEIDNKLALMKFLKDFPRGIDNFTFNLPLEEIDDEVKAEFKRIVASSFIENIFYLRDKGLHNNFLDKQLINAIIKQRLVYNVSEEMFGSLMKRPIPKEVIIDTIKDYSEKGSELSLNLLKNFAKRWGYNMADFNFPSSTCPTHIMSGLTQ